MHILSYSILSFILLIGSTTAKSTMVGLETAESSRAVQVPLNDCHEIDEDEVFTVSVSKKCRLFTGPLCTGRNILLLPGDHSNADPVPIQSIYCEEK